MNLAKELRLQKATITGSENIDTKEGMKTVIVIEAPLGKSDADVIGCGMLYANNGAPLAGIGSFKPEGKLESIKVEIPLGDNDLAEFKPEKIGPISIKHVEDVGLVITLRVHILNEVLAAAAVHNQKRGSDFHLIIRPLQRGLFDEQPDSKTKETPGKPVLNSEQDDQTELIPFKAKKCFAEIGIRGGSDDGYQVGWAATLHFRHGKAIDESLSENSPNKATREAAIAHAVLKLAVFVREAKAVPRAVEEEKALDQMFSWLEDLSPNGVIEVVPSSVPPKAKRGNKAVN